MTFCGNLPVLQTLLSLHVRHVYRVFPVKSNFSLFEQTVYMWQNDYFFFYHKKEEKKFKESNDEPKTDRNSVFPGDSVRPWVALWSLWIKQTRMHKSWHTFDLCLIQRNAHYSSTHHFPVSSGDSGRSWHSINSLQIRRVSTIRYSSHIKYPNFVCKNLFKVYVKFGICNSLVSHRFRTAPVLPALRTPPKTRGHN